MLNSWQIGEFRVSSIVEYYGPTHDPAALFPSFERASFGEAAAQLPRGHYYSASDRLVIAIQIWLIEAGSRRILIDAGCGNGKSRRTARMHQLNSLWPEWLAAAGQSFNSITDVVLTHLHSDHVGWNTRAEDGQWRPAFPNARYHIPRDDYDFFRAAHSDGRIADGGSFADSVEPVVAAGLVDFIVDEATVAGCLKVAPAPGHTPGQLNYWLESRGEHGVFSADVLHHAVQVMRPDWNSAFCILPDEARRTRAGLLDEAARTGALVMPCHFAPPHAGYIRRMGRGFVFEPAGGPASSDYG